MSTHEDLISNLEQICGWILPDGTWLVTDEWWHIQALYELQEKKHPAFSSPEASNIFKLGDEAKIRDWASQAGFIKIAQGQIDAINMNRAQLEQLKKLLSILNPDEKIEILYGNTGIIKSFLISRILKLKNSSILFSNAIS